MLDPDRANEIAAATADLPNKKAWRKIDSLLRADGWGFRGYPRKQVWEARRRLLADRHALARAGAVTGEIIVKARP